VRLVEQHPRSAGWTRRIVARSSPCPPPTSTTLLTPAKS
jgi:hypothetical protein